MRRDSKLVAGILIVIAGALVVWFVGPAEWHAALDRVERRAPPADDVSQRDDRRPPVLAGHPDAAPAPAPAPVQSPAPPDPVGSSEDETAWRLAGVVTNEDGREVAGASLLVWGAGLDLQQIRSGERGLFDATLPAPAGRGRRQVVVFSPGYELWGAYPLGETADRLEIVLRRDLRRASLCVEVLLPGGDPAAGAWVDAGVRGPDNGAMIGGPDLWGTWSPTTGLADQEGRFVVHRLDPGPRGVWAHLGDLLAEGVCDLTYPRGDVVLRLAPGRTIRGRVRVARSGALEAEPAAIRVRVHQESPSRAGWSHLDAHVQAGSETATEFEIRGAPAVPLVLTFQAPAHERVRAEVAAGRAEETVDVGEILLPLRAR